MHVQKKRFFGIEPEPRAGLRSGHMPNAHNLPFPEVLNGYYMKPIEELIAILSLKANTQNKLIMSCGSGVTSCILALAATLANYNKISVYDGSWSEWGLPSARPIVTN